MSVGSGTYCQACVPRINVCGQHYIIVDEFEGAHPGSRDDMHNNYLVRCPNSGEGCEWTGRPVGRGGSNEPPQFGS